jgi:toxin ParE1/3/4
MLRVRVRTPASQDLVDLTAYLEENAGVRTADRFLESVKMGFDALAAMPTLGSARAYSAPSAAGIRVWAVPRFPKYLIFYQVTADAVEVVRVLHSARNLDEVFAGKAAE